MQGLIVRASLTDQYAYKAFPCQMDMFAKKKIDDGYRVASNRRGRRKEQNT